MKYLSFYPTKFEVVFYTAVIKVWVCVYTYNIYYIIIILCMCGYIYMHNCFYF